MSNNARTGISSAALRYLKLIEQNEENGDGNVRTLSSDVYNKLNEDNEKQNESLMLSFNNPFAENKQDGSLMNPFKDQFSLNEPKMSDDVVMNSYNNPFVENDNNQQECSFLQPSNNPFIDNLNNQQNNNFFSENVQNPVNNQMKRFNNTLDASDILIDDSDINFRPETTQMSFNYSKDSENSLLVPTSSAKSLEFGSSSNQSYTSPPQKRYCFDTKESFFDRKNAEQIAAFESFFKKPGQSEVSESFLKPNEKHQNFTDEIFDVQNFNRSYSTRDDDSLIESVFQQPSSLCETVGNSESVMDPTLKNELNKMNDSSSEESSDESTEEDTSKENATTSTKNRIRKVNTFYQASDIPNTQKIDEFYENLNAIDWQSDDINLDNIMEPSIDYILQRLQCLRPLTTGREDALISFDDEDEYLCESINEGIDEIEETFDEGKFICSTPEEPENPEDRGHPLDFGNLNMPINMETSTNVAQGNDNEDNDKTKSFLVNKETENVWSAITHVSCSIPVNEQVEQESSEAQFDITTIFDFTNQNDLINNQESEPKCVDNDTARYELMLSILKDCNNPIDQTTAEVQETLKIAENRKAAILVQIEMLIEALVTSAVNQETMIIKLHRIKDWNDCKYESNVLSQKETAIKIKSLSFTNKITERTFTIVVHLLGEIYKLLGQNITCTKRELYYRDVELMKSQVSVNKAIDEICTLLNVQCWELGVLSTSKGLVAGDLRIVTDEDEIIDYSITTNSVPQKPSGIKSMESNAEYVLVVEKDTVFTRLIEDNIMDKIGRKIILVTAKGYPDINTRVLLKRIELELQKPIYIIVDADAYGIDIMCTYKFGSLQMVNFSEQLAIPTMEWIGIHPTDIEKLDITRIQLTDADVKKVDELLARPYINDHLKTELEHLKFRGLKAEIESIYHFSVDYLVNDYIPQKIAAIHGPMGDIIRGSACFEENLFA